MSKIEWTDMTWNPTTGCEKVSTGCRGCYAEVMTRRLSAMGQKKYQGILTESGRFNGTVRTHDDALRLPLSWNKPRKVFVDSMSDLFHKDVPFDFIDQVFAVMALTPQHTYQILTKRTEGAVEYLTGCPTQRIERHLLAIHQTIPLKDRVTGYGRPKWPLPNVWIGTSVEDQAAADERIPRLLNCPAAVRFLSMEPLVGPVDLLKEYPTGKGTVSYGAFVDWVIAGGESGPNARPVHPDWVRSIRDQCAQADIPFFFKQWGNYCPPECYPFKAGSPDIARCERFVFPDGVEVYKAGKQHTGNLLDGRQYLHFPKQ